MKRPVGGENFSLKAKQDTFTAFVCLETILRPVYQSDERDKFPPLSGCEDLYSMRGCVGGLLRR